MQIKTIFPTTFTISQLARDLTQEERKAIIDYSKELRVNRGGNHVSKDSEILDNDSRLASLRTFIIGEINKYFEDILCIADGLTPFITQSWLNYTYESERHHRHIHTNSIVSGVFYINVDEQDQIHFFKNTNELISFDKKNSNEYNSVETSVSVKNNMLLLFPSQLSHSVDTVNSKDHCRISLAFNVFVKGGLGSKSDLTWLHIA